MGNLFPHPGIPNFNISQQYVDDMRKITSDPDFRKSVAIAEKILNNPVQSILKRTEQCTKMNQDAENVSNTQETRPQVKLELTVSVVIK